MASVEVSAPQRPNRAKPEYVIKCMPGGKIRVEDNNFAEFWLNIQLSDEDLDVLSTANDEDDLAAEKRKHKQAAGKQTKDKE